LLFCIVAQVNTGFVTENWRDGFSAETVEVAQTVLLKYIDKRCDATAALPQVHPVADVVRELRIALDRPSGALSSEFIVPLYDAAHAAARVLFLDRDVFMEFLHRRKIAADTLQAGNVFSRSSAVAHNSPSGLLSHSSANELCNPKLIEETPAPSAPMHPAWWAVAPIVLRSRLSAAFFMGRIYAAARWMSSQSKEARLAEVNDRKSPFPRGKELRADLND
jgi:hypothetical protein